MTEAWDMRSNIKAKPGSQGTLFQPASKRVLNPQQRWPQGYTPERLNEVRGALKDTYLAPPQDLYDLPDDEAQRDYGANVFGYREHLTREIAKTAVPAEHLEGLREIVGEPDTGDYGTYWPQRKRIGINMVDPDNPVPGRTLTHEIGHHFHNDGTTSHGSYEAMTAINAAGEKDAYRNLGKYRDHPTRSGILMGQNRVQAGVHEALADNYMIEHYRSGGRKPKSTDVGQYERHFTGEELDRDYPGYTDVRPAPLQQQQFHQDEIGEIVHPSEDDPFRQPGYRVAEAKKDAVRWATNPLTGWEDQLL